MEKTGESLKDGLEGEKNAHTQTAMGLCDVGKEKIDMLVLCKSPHSVFNKSGPCSTVHEY